MLVYESQMNPFPKCLNVEKTLDDFWEYGLYLLVFFGFLKHLHSLIRLLRLKIAQNSWRWLFEISALKSPNAIMVSCFEKYWLNLCESIATNF